MVQDLPPHPHPQRQPDMATLSAAEIYANELIPWRLGMPMWCPEPPVGGEVKLADVGFIQDGLFCRLFNAVTGGGEGNNPATLPAGFEPVNIPEHLIRKLPNYLPQSPISSQTTREVDVVLSAYVTRILF